MIDAEPPAWLGRMILHDELRGLGLPWVPEAMWQRPRDQWLTLDDTFTAVALSSSLVWAIRRRGIENHWWRWSVKILAREKKKGRPADAIRSRPVKSGSVEFRRTSH